MSIKKFLESEIAKILKALDAHDPLTIHYGAKGLVASSAHAQCRKLARRFGYDWNPDFGLTT